MIESLKKIWKDERGIFGIDDMLIGAGVLGGLNLFGSSQTNAANAREAQLNRDFQNMQGMKAYDRARTMRQTAYQDTTADMIKAGINPMSAFQQGPTAGGAGMQGGSVSNPQMENTIGRAAESAFSAARLSMDLKQANADVALKEAAALTEVAKAERETWSARSAMEDVELKTQERWRNRTSEGAFKKEAEARENEAGLDLQMRARERILRQVGQGAQIFNSATGGLGNLMDLIPGAGKAGKVMRGTNRRYPSLGLEDFDLERAGPRGISR